MPFNSIFLRGCAIVFAGAIVAIDGRASVLQAYANQWTDDTVVLIAAAVIMASCAPTFLSAAVRAANHSAAALLGVAFIVSAVTSASLTLQRIGAQVDAQNHALNTRNHPIRTNAARITEQRAALVQIDKDVPVAEALVAKHTGRMETERTRCARRGACVGPAWRDARDKRDQADADLRKLNSKRENVEAQLAQFETMRDKLGPIERSSYAGFGAVVVYAAALFPLPASIGLLLYAFGATANVTTPTPARREVTAASQGEMKSRGSELVRTSPRESEVTHPDKTPAVQGPTREVTRQPCEVTRNAVTPRLDPSAPLTMQGDVVADILAAARRYGTLPTWTQCRNRYTKADGSQLATATITKYRRLAAAQWQAMQRAQQSANRSLQS